MRRILSGVILLLSIQLQAQHITHGPVFGSLTDQSVKVYIKTAKEGSVKAEVSTDSTFSGGYFTYFGATSSELNFSEILEINNLEPSTKYFIRFSFDLKGDTTKGSFKTLPPVGQPSHLVFVAGSCQETPNMKVFDVMPLHQPDMLIHLGDFTYPSYQLPGSLNYPDNPESIKVAWQRRYEEIEMRDMLRHTPMAYMPDDDDSWGSAREYTIRPKVRRENGKLINYFEKDSITPQARQNCIEGYETYFPGYPLENNEEGYYHSFKAGNAEFFVLDLRSMAISTDELFGYNRQANIWKFAPQGYHSILGQNQLEWLKKGLKNSTATWKFMVMGMPFNKNLKRLIEVGTLLQGLELTVAGETGTGFRLAVAFANYFAGFPTEQNNLLKYIKNENISNVIVISGDTHHNVIDDGTNAGLPEMNASGLSVTSTFLAYQIDNYLKMFGLPTVKDQLWNRGGNGIDNENFKNAFGKIEIFKDDSVKLSIIDEDNLELADLVIHNRGSFSTPVIDRKQNAKLVMYPNPAENFIVVDAGEGINDIESIKIFDMQGATILDKTSFELKNEGLYYIDISTLPKGAYVINAYRGQENISGSFIKK